MLATDTITYSVTAGTEFNITLDSTSSPSDIQIPDLIGIPEATYTFTIKATSDDDGTITAQYLFKIKVTDPCTITQINIQAIAELSLLIDTSANSYQIVAPDTVS